MVDLSPLRKGTLGHYALDCIHCGDCAVLMEQLPDDCIDLTVTSPPYDNLRDYEGYVFDFESIAQQLYRITKVGGVVVWVVADETKDFCESLSGFRQSIYFVDVCGFNLLDTMFYHKKNYAPAYPTLRRYAGVVEYMFILTKGRPRTFNTLIERKAFSSVSSSRKATSFANVDGTKTRKYVDTSSGQKARTNLWAYWTGYTGRDVCKHSHPAIFPEALAADHIKSWSNKGDIVFDPMCGSGTTCKMAKLLGRKFLGFDISEKYVKLAQARIDNEPYPLF